MFIDQFPHLLTLSTEVTPTTLNPDWPYIAHQVFNQIKAGLPLSTFFGIFLGGHFSDMSCESNAYQIAGMLT